MHCFWKCELVQLRKTGSIYQSWAQAYPKTQKFHCQVLIQQKCIHVYERTYCSVFNAAIFITEPNPHQELLYSRVSRPDTIGIGSWICFNVGVLPLASTTKCHSALCLPVTPSRDNQKCLQISPNVPWGTKSSLTISRTSFSTQQWDWINTTICENTTKGESHKHNIDQKPNKRKTKKHGHRLCTSIYIKVKVICVVRHQGDYWDAGYLGLFNLWNCIKLNTNDMCTCLRYTILHQKWMNEGMKEWNESWSFCQKNSFREV